MAPHPAHPVLHPMPPRVLAAPLPPCLLPPSQMYDAWLERMAAEEDPVPWGEKEEKVVGRWHGYCSDAPALERGGGTERCIRAAYQNHTRDTEGRFTSFLPEFMTLSDQRRFKYTFSTDGLGCSNRLQKVLATGQVVVKQDSVLEGAAHGRGGRAGAARQAAARRQALLPADLPLHSPCRPCRQNGFTARCGPGCITCPLAGTA